MVLITIVDGVYKPTYNGGGPHCTISMTIYLPGTAPPQLRWQCGGSPDLDFSISKRSWASPISQLMNHRNHKEISILLAYSPCSDATTSLLLMFRLCFIPHCQLKITLRSHQNPRRITLTSPQICLVSLYS